MSASQIFAGLALIVGLAVACQIIAAKFGIPAIILLLPAGFAAGTLTTVVNPDKIFGAAFPPLVRLAVAIILFDGGLDLVTNGLEGDSRRVVRRLRGWGIPVAWAWAISVKRFNPSPAPLPRGILAGRDGRGPASSRPAPSRTPGPARWGWSSPSRRGSSGSPPTSSGASWPPPTWRPDGATPTPTATALFRRRRRCRRPAAGPALGRVPRSVRWPVRIG
jgi:hypothetical protein